MVTGLFRDRQSVELAYQCVIQRGYDASDINVAMSDDTRKQLFSGDDQIDRDFGDKVAEGGELGGPVGGTVGTVIPVFVAVASFMAFPALGLVAAGPVTAALTGAGAAGLAVALIGALSDWGIPEERIRKYAAGIHDGGVLLGVKPRSEADARYFEQRWTASGGLNLHA
jgi:hypothetical protein